MAIDFGGVFMELEAMGLFEIMLPFLLVFTVSFAVINRTKIFGDRKGVDVVNYAFASQPDNAALKGLPF